MKGETYLYAVNALAGADDGGVWKASDFMSADCVISNIRIENASS